MSGLNFEWELLAPEYILVGWAGALVMLDLFWPKLVGKEPLGVTYVLEDVGGDDAPRRTILKRNEDADDPRDPGGGERPPEERLPASRGGT